MKKMENYSIGNQTFSFLSQKECKEIVAIDEKYFNNCEKEYEKIVYEMNDSLYNANQLLRHIQNFDGERIIEICYENPSGISKFLNNSLIFVDEIQEIFPENFDLDHIKSEVINNYCDFLINISNESNKQSAKNNIKEEIVNLLKRSNEYVYCSIDKLEDSMDVPPIFKKTYNYELHSDILRNNTKIAYMYKHLNEPKFFLTDSDNKTIENYLLFNNSCIAGENIFETMKEKTVFYSEESFNSALMDYIQLKYFSLNDQNLEDVTNYLNHLDRWFFDDKNFIKLKEMIYSIPEEDLIRNGFN